MVFWGSFVASMAIAIEEAMSVCEKYKSNKKEPNWDCCRACLHLTETICLNALLIYIGYLQIGKSCRALKNSDTTSGIKSITRKSNSKMYLIKNILLIGLLVSILMISFIVGMNYHALNLVKHIYEYITMLLV